MRQARASGPSSPPAEPDGQEPGRCLPLRAGKPRPRMRWRAWLAAGVAVVGATAAAAGALGFLGSRPGGLPVIGRVIPAVQRPAAPLISGTTLTGRHLNIASWRGHTVVINFWGSWCVPCRKEAPVLRRVAGDTRALGVRFAGIDIREGPAAGLAFEDHYHVPYPSISDPDNLIGTGFGPAAPVATPSTYIIDARGRIAWAWFGATTYPQLESAVAGVALRWTTTSRSRS